MLFGLNRHFQSQGYGKVGVFDIDVIILDNFGAIKSEIYFLIGEGPEFKNPGASF